MSKNKTAFDIGAITREHKQGLIEAGYLNAHKIKVLNAVAPESKKGIPWQELFLLLWGHPHDLCTQCKCGTMRRIASFKPDVRGSQTANRPLKITHPVSI